MFQLMKCSLRLWDPVLNSGCMYQSVRWRKTRHVPIAKSKIGRVRIPTPIDPAEYKFMLQKWDPYRTLMKAVRNHFVQEIKQKSKETVAGVSLEEEEQKEEAEWQTLLSWNDKENAKTRQMREERLAEKSRVNEEYRLDALLEVEKREAQWLQELEELVKKEKEASKYFINLDNMDEAIEAALSEEKNYLFSITKKGDIILPDDTAWHELKERLQPQVKEN